jgi:hypothetical protein
MSTLYVDTINEKTVNNGVYIPDHVLQVVQGTVGSTTSGVTASGANSFTDSGLQANITPSSASSKILIKYEIFLGNSASGYQSKSRIVRDSTPIGVGTQEGTRGVASAVAKSYSNYASNGQYHTFQQGICFLDEPATTSQITYKIQVAAYSALTWYLNRAQTFQDGGAGGYDAIPLSVITLMEIGA